MAYSQQCTVINHVHMCVFPLPLVHDTSTSWRLLPWIVL